MRPWTRLAAWSSTVGDHRRRQQVQATLALAILFVWNVFGPRRTVGGVLTTGAIWATVVLGTALGTWSGAWARCHRARTWMTALLLLAVAALVVVTLAPGIVRRLSSLLTMRREPTVEAVTASVVATVAVLAIAILVGWVIRRAARPEELLVLAAVTGFIVFDIVIVNSRGLRDFDLYLSAGSDFLHGHLPYANDPLSHLPFVYPPPLIPLFAAIAWLPSIPVTMAWIALALSASIWSLRAFGLRWRWVAFLLLWPAFVEGLWVGNVATIMLAFLAVAPRLPAALVPPVLAKLQYGIPALWLVRERRWRSLVAGVLMVVILIIVTLPIVGVDAYGQWIAQLRTFQSTLASFPAIYGLALPRYLPFPAYIGVAVVAVVGATILGRGLRGLARLSVASIVASPTLYHHGFLVALPGLLGASGVLFWLAMGFSTSASAGWWVVVAIAAVGTFQKGGADRESPSIHPLGAAHEPWSGFSPRAWSPPLGEEARTSADAHR